MSAIHNSRRLYVLGSVDTITLAIQKAPKQENQTGVLGELGQKHAEPDLHILKRVMETDLSVRAVQVTLKALRDIGIGAHATGGGLAWEISHTRIRALKKKPVLRKRAHCFSLKPDIVVKPKRGLLTKEKPRLIVCTPAAALRDQVQLKR